MIPHFQRNNNEKRLAKWVREYMWQQFMLSEEYLNELRCFEHEENINGNQIMHIYIFHSRLARCQHASLRTHSDLKQHREIILYEGYVDDQGSVYVEDRRTMSYPKKMLGQRTLL